MWIVQYYDGIQWFRKYFKEELDAEEFYNEVRNEPPYPFVKRPALVWSAC